MEILTIVNLLTLVYALYCISTNKKTAKHIEKIAINVAQQTDTLVQINQQISDELTHARDTLESTLKNAQPSPATDKRG